MLLLTALNKAQFSPAKWQRLGLRLGLYKNTLDVIEADNQSSEACLTECLTKWFKGVDGVDEKGGPTPAVLADALEEIGDADSAMYISKCMLEMSCSDVFHVLYMYALVGDCTYGAHTTGQQSMILYHF